MKLSFSICISCIWFMKTIQEVQNDVNMDIIKFVNKYDYPVETHEVETEDGYILTIFRIPRGRNKFNKSPNSYPVLMNHALLTSSEIYVALGPRKSLSFVLADHGYDVWLMNSRGAWHSKRHKKLTTNQKMFWRFSWHEIGVYDIPAVIDYILMVTANTDLFYVGHSQGCTSFFVMGSERPEYNSKIKVMIGLAPGARYKYIRQPLLRMLMPHNKLIEALADYLGIYEIPTSLLSVTLIKRLFKSMCLTSDGISLICKLIVEGISHLIDLEDLPVLITVVPSTFSVKQAIHYAQLGVSGNFQQYDWGKKENLKRYGTENPSVYNVKNITCPVALFWGASDDLVVNEDVQYLREEAPNIIEDYQVPPDEFNHLDFVVSHNLKKMYDRILEVLSKFK